MPSVDEAREAYEQAILDAFEEEIPEDVKFVAKELFAKTPRTGNPNDLVSHLDRDYEYENSGLNHHKMREMYMPSWATFVELAYGAIDAVRALDAKNR